MKNIILLLSIFSFTSTTYAATISGTVTDSQSGKPISGASVVFRISISNDHLKISNEILDSLKNTYETKQLMYSPEWRRETEQEIARMERNLQVFQEEIDSTVDGILGQLDDPAVQTEDGDLDMLGDFDLESNQEEEFRNAESQLQMELDSLKNKYEEIPTGMQYRNARWRMENKIATMERNLQVFQKETEALAREKAEALAREETRAKAVREIIRKAKVGKLDTLATAVTKSDGSFSFDVDYVLRAARYDVVVSAEGYEDGQNIIRFKTGKETLTSNIALDIYVYIPQWVDDVGQEYPTIDILTQYNKYMEYCERENKSVIKSGFELWIMEVEIIKEREQNIISHFYNPNLLIYPTDYYWVKERGETRMGARGWIKSPFKEASVRIEGSVFGKKTGVTFEYCKEGQHGCWGQLGDILFDDIPDPSTGSPPTSFKNVIEPEIIENQFQNYQGWKPIQYLSEKNIMLFAYRKYEESENIPIFYLLNLKKGTVEKRENEGFIKNTGILFSSGFPGRLLTLSSKNEDAHKSGSEKIYFNEKNYQVTDSDDPDKMMNAYVADRLDWSQHDIIYYDYVSDTVLDRITIKRIKPKYRWNSFGVENFNLSSNSKWETDERIKYFVVEEWVINNGYVDLEIDISWVNDDNLWFRLLSDNFFTSTTDRWVKYGYVGEDKFKYVYSISESDVNKELFGIISDLISTIKSGRVYDQGSWGTEREKVMITYHFKISESGLIKMFDRYGAIYVFNLNKNGLRERKFSSIQIKNNMLSDEDKRYLEQFNSRIGPTDLKY